jgi:multidrug resistance efflux pump
MTAPTPNPTSREKEALIALNILNILNRLIVNAFKSKKRQALSFLILNDTVQMTRYDRAVLWDFDRSKPSLLGVSGQSSINATTDIAKRWQRLVQNLKHPGQIQILSSESFKSEQTLWKEYEESNSRPSVLWFPITAHDRMATGLWLERWEGMKWSNQEVEILNPLIQAYGLAWEKFTPHYSWRTLRKLLYWTLGLTLLLLLFAIRIPLRIVAPCEVVPKDPILITAPLEDIIEKINVKPGQFVHVNDPLFEYDKRVALQTLKIAENQLQVAQQDLSRAKTLAFKEERSLTEISILMAKLKKEEANLELAKYRASQLIAHSPTNGIAMLENPDEWRGKPVKVGEKILLVIDPKKTKVRLWIPENDNIGLDIKKSIYVFLNTSPTVTREAKLMFISNASTITEKHVVSFMAEAEWTKPQDDIRVGLKGSAILYGEKVSLFYWLIRKPWATFREFIGF